MHVIIERTPEDAYPIRAWGVLWEMIRGMDVDDVKLIVPAAGPVPLRTILEVNGPVLEEVLGEHYFPLEGQQDFAYKAGLGIMQLVLRQFGSPSRQEREATGEAAAELEAFKEEFEKRGAE